MRGLTQKLEEARTYRGARLRPQTFEAFWEPSVTFANATQPEWEREKSSYTQQVQFKQIGIRSTDHMSISARLVIPTKRVVTSSTQESAVIVLFSDLGRGVRSWLHLLRFTALGFPVVALESRTCEKSMSDAWRGELSAKDLVRVLIDPQDIEHSFCKQLIDDALVTTAFAQHYFDCPAIVWGEGFGGSQALFAAALLPDTVRATMALNPVCADNAAMFTQGGGDEKTLLSSAMIDAVGLLDAACAAELIKVPTLIGTSLLDTCAPTKNTFAIFNRLSGQKQIHVYPKHAHERINNFENSQILFLQDVVKNKSIDTPIT